MEAVPRRVGRGERRFEEGRQDRGRGLLNSERCLLGCASQDPCRQTKETCPKLDPHKTPSTSNAIDRDNNSSLSHFLGLNLKPRARSINQVLICLYYMYNPKVAVPYEFSEIYANW